MNLKTGNYNAHPYIISGNIQKTPPAKTVFLFPGSEALVIGENNFPHIFTILYKRLFPRDFSIIILGYTPRKNNATRPDEVAREFHVMLRELVGHGGLVMGISYGGFVALSFASLYPTLVKGVILGSSAHGVSASGRQIALNWIRALRNGSFKHLFKDFLKLFRNPANRIALSILVSLAWPIIEKKLNHPFDLVVAYEGAFRMETLAKEILPHITCKLLLLIGDQDQFFSLSICSELVKNVPRATMKCFNGETHTLLFERPKKCKNIIVKFIKDL